MNHSTHSFNLSRLLQLASPALPVGAYTYSQGLEWAVECGWIHSEQSAQDWIDSVLSHAFSSFELPLLQQQLMAWGSKDLSSIKRLNQKFVASRETAEMRAETLQMGYSLLRLANDLELLASDHKAFFEDTVECAYPTAWTAVATSWKVNVTDALQAYAWSWLENQVMAAIKAVPLGQTAGQRILFNLGAKIQPISMAASLLDEREWSNYSPALSIASSLHETQYSRLFRS